MATQVQVLQTNDVVWTLGEGQLKGWKVTEKGHLVELAQHEAEAVMRTSDPSRLRVLTR